MVAYANRCVCITLKGRRCLNAFSFVCNKTRCCYIHAYAYVSYALIIQAAYKGYRSRKYVKLLAKLPCDVQQKILYYVREPYYNAKRNKSIQKILCKKFEAMLGTPKAICGGFIMSNINVFLGHYRARVTAMNKAQFNEHILLIAHLYKLYTKYMTIADTNYENALYHVSNIVIKHIKECLYYYHHLGQYSNSEILELNNNMARLQNNISAFKSKYLNLNINS